jgi:hypothetical protein
MSTSENLADVTNRVHDHLEKLVNGHKERLLAAIKREEPIELFGSLCAFIYSLTEYRDALLEGAPPEEKQLLEMLLATGTVDQILMVSSVFSPVCGNPDCPKHGTAAKQAAAAQPQPPSDAVVM